MENETVTTSVDVFHDKFIKFKEICLRDDMNFKKFVNRSLDLYLNDEKFYNKIKDYNKLESSGSRF